MAADDMIRGLAQAGGFLQDLLKGASPKQKKILYAAWNSQYDRGLSPRADEIRMTALNTMGGGVDDFGRGASRATDEVMDMAERIASKVTGRSRDTMPPMIRFRDMMNKTSQLSGGEVPYRSPENWMAPAYQMDDVIREVTPGLVAADSLPVLDRKLLTEPVRMLELYRKQSPAVQKVLDRIAKDNGDVLNPMDFLIARRIARG
jgi:hypothetical protein